MFKSRDNAKESISHDMKLKLCKKVRKLGNDGIAQLVQKVLDVNSRAINVSDQDKV